MSADINIKPDVRQAYTAYRYSVSTPLSASFHSMSPRMPLSPLYSHESPVNSSSPRLRPPPLGSSPQLTSTNLPATPIITEEELQHLRKLTTPVPVPSPNMPFDPNDSPEAYTSIHSSLNIYLGDLFSATRHHPQLDGTLLTLRAHRDAEDLARAYRVICGDSIGAELITTVASAPPFDMLGTDSQSPSDDEVYTVDDHGIPWDHAADENEWLGAELKMGKRKASSIRSVEVRIQGPDTDSRGAPFESRESLAAPGFGGQSFMSPFPLPPEVWDVSEVDIARIFPRVVSHRVRVRSGPDDEILGSIMHPAVRPQPSSDVPLAERKTVKQIMVEILADV